MIIDVNVSVTHWPLRRTPCDEISPLLARLKKHRVTQAWAGNIEGIFHRDVEGVNRRLAEMCRQQREPELVPFGTVNPMLPDWREDVRRCREVHHMPGIRLHPNYHGYRLDDPVFADLLDAAAERNMIVQIVVRMDDVRLQSPILRVPDVDLKPLAAVLTTRPRLPLVILNGLGAARVSLLAALAKSARVYCDIATQEGIAGVAGLTKALSPDRLLFGSHLPLFCLESAVLKMRESALHPQHQNLIEFDNATQLLAQARQNK